MEDVIKNRASKVKREANRLKKVFVSLPKDKMDTALSMVQNAAFMTVTLQELQEKMMTDGIVVSYKNGANQFGTKKSPEVEIYNTMVKNHMAIIKQLTELLPAGELFPEKVKPEDKLVSFLNANRKKKA